MSAPSTVCVRAGSLHLASPASNPLHCGPAHVGNAGEGDAATGGRGELPGALVSPVEVFVRKTEIKSQPAINSNTRPETSRSSRLASKDRSSTTDITDITPF